jgi:hypothetical protein
MNGIGLADQEKCWSGLPGSSKHGGCLAAWQRFRMFHVEHFPQEAAEAVASGKDCSTWNIFCGTRPLGRDQPPATQAAIKLSFQPSTIAITPAR